MPFITLLPGFPPSGPMTLGPTPPPKVGVEEMHQDPSDLGRNKNEGHEVPNIFNNQMGPIGQFYIFVSIFTKEVNLAYLHFNFL